MPEPTQEQRGHEDAAIRQLEHAGWKHEYTYTPDGQMRRFVFSRRQGETPVVLHGIDELEKEAYRHGTRRVSDG